MKRSSYLLTLLVSAVAFNGGCAAQDVEESFATEPLDVSLEQAAGYGGGKDPPCGYNGMLPYEFWSATAQYGIRDLGKTPLGSGGMTMISGVSYPTLPTSTWPAIGALAATYPAVLKDLIECALPRTDSVYDPVSGKLYSGWWGLAPSWVASSLVTNPGVQKWMTGCMIARLNNMGLHVDVLLEGNYMPIQVNPAYNALYGFQESTVDGNMFTSTTVPTQTDPAFSVYLCRENSLMDVCPDGGARWTDKRICDNAPTKCGLVDIGPCDPARSTSPNCIPNGEHWLCKNPPGTMHVFETVGVQLLDPVTAAECN